MPHGFVLWALIVIPAKRYLQEAQGMRLLSHGTNGAAWATGSNAAAWEQGQTLQHSRARCIGDGTADTQRWSAGHTLPRCSVGTRRAPGPGLNRGRYAD
jgi:hypothetical protein